MPAAAALGRFLTVLAPPPSGKMDILLYGLALAGSLLVGAAVIALASRWRKKEDKVTLSPSDQLARFRAMYDKGALSKEEFERLRALLAAKIREEMEMPPSPHPVGPEPGPGQQAIQQPPGQGAPPNGSATRPDHPDEGIRPA